MTCTGGSSSGASSSNGNSSSSSSRPLHEMPLEHGPYLTNAQVSIYFIDIDMY
jgi:hypothetical protein